MPQKLLEICLQAIEDYMKLLTFTWIKVSVGVLQPFLSGMTVVNRAKVLDM